MHDENERRTRQRLKRSNTSTKLENKKESLGSKSRRKNKQLLLYFNREAQNEWNKD
jgi:hypothetical protein